VIQKPKLGWKAFSLLRRADHLMPFVNHVEFEVTNLRRAAKFYKSVLGLKIRIIPEMKYALWSAARKPGGGLALVRKKRVKHGGTTAIFQVDNIERYLQKAKKAGGRIVQKKTEIPGGMGYYGTFRDPFGNIIGLWSSH
jgi:predicted enzyme related to lactoylglutathione lyase